MDRPDTEHRSHIPVKITSSSDDLPHFLKAVGQASALKIEERLGDGFVRLHVAEAERRQAKQDIRSLEDALIELLRNSRDAHASQIFVASSKEGTCRKITVLDDGDGIPKHLHQRVFEARVTSKLTSIREDSWGIHGRGMALFSIHENVDSIGIVASGEDLGTALALSVSTEKLSERSDQSSWPTLKESQLFGPHNLIRVCCEFVLEKDTQTDVFYGSPAEIIAAVRAYHRPSQEMSSYLFVDDLSDIAVLDRLLIAVDAAELADTAACLGLLISERTAHRILAKEITPAPSAMVYLRKAALARSLPNRASRAAPVELPSAAKTSSNIANDPYEIAQELLADQRKLHMSQEELEHFSAACVRAFKPLADRYYLQVSASPQISLRGHTITLRFSLEELE